LIHLPSRTCYPRKFLGKPNWWRWSEDCRTSGFFHYIQTAVSHQFICFRQSDRESCWSELLQDGREFQSNIESIMIERTTTLKLLQDFPSLRKHQSIFAVIFWESLRFGWMISLDCGDWGTNLLTAHKSHSIRKEENKTISPLTN
jgi:hypothetical protein